MLHGLVLFATKLETADTSEVTVLHNYAPPLYSAVDCVWYPSCANQNPNSLPTRNDKESFLWDCLRRERLAL